MPKSASMEHLMKEPGPNGEIPSPGIYSISNNAYHSDLPCGPNGERSLSSSGARTIVTKSPKKFKWDRDNREDEGDSKVLNFGKSAHSWILEPEKWLEDNVLLPEGFTRHSKANKALWAEIVDAGKTPVKTDELDQIKAMKAAIEEDPIAMLAFRNGVAEKSLYWKDPEFEVWCRCRPDWLPTKTTENGRMLNPDYKTTQDITYEPLARSIMNYGYHQQADWYLRGLRALGLCEDPIFLFVFQEKTPPYEVVVVEPPGSDLEIGATLNRKAMDRFKICTATDEWPGHYPAGKIVNVETPAYYTNRFDGLNASGHYNTESDK